MQNDIIVIRICWFGAYAIFIVAQLPNFILQTHMFT